MIVLLFLARWGAAWNNGVRKWFTNGTLSASGSWKQCGDCVVVPRLEDERIEPRNSAVESTCQGETPFSIWKGVVAPGVLAVPRIERPESRNSAVESTCQGETPFSIWRGVVAPGVLAVPRSMGHCSE